MSTRRKFVAEVNTLFPEPPETRTRTLKGKIIGCGWVSYNNEKQGSYFLIQEGRKVHRCIKDKGIYDPRQLDLTVEVTGEWVDDMLVISSIKRVEE